MKKTEKFHTQRLSALKLDFLEAPPPSKTVKTMRRTLAKDLNFIYNGKVLLCQK